MLPFAFVRTTLTFVLTISCNRSCPIFLSPHKSFLSPMLLLVQFLLLLPAEYEYKMALQITNCCTDIIDSSNTNYQCLTDIQNIPEIPEDLRNIYKTVWEIKQRTLVDMAADRGCYIDQSQSLNIHMDQPNFGKLTSLHFHDWSKGLKTRMYYLRSRAATDAIKFTVDTNMLKEKNMPVTEDENTKLAQMDSPLVVFGRTFSDRETLRILIVSNIFVIFLTRVGSILISALLVGWFGGGFSVINAGDGFYSW